MIGGKQSKKIHKDHGTRHVEIDSQRVKLIFEWFSAHDSFTEVSRHVLRILQTSFYITLISIDIIIVIKFIIAMFHFRWMIP